MANKFGTNDDWIDGDVLTAADQLDTFNNIRSFGSLGFGVNAGNHVSVIAHTATTWSGVNFSGVVRQTTDSGANWTTKSSVLDTVSLLQVCLADSTHGVGIETGTTNEVVFTDDSGATWAAATSAAFGTALYDVDFATAGLIVLAGDDGGGAKHIIFSTDDGATWTDSTTPPSAACHAVAMFDASTGYTVDSSGNIWKTTDGAVTWTDTTDGVAVFTTLISMVCVTADLVIINEGDRVETYVNSTNTVLSAVKSSMSNTAALGSVINSAGTIACGFGAPAAGTVTPYEIYLSQDNGTTWEYLQVGFRDTESIINKKFLTLGSNDGFFINTRDDSFYYLRDT